MCQFPQMRVILYDPQNILILIAGFPKKGTPNLGNPHIRGHMILGTQVLGVPTMNCSIWVSMVQSPYLCKLPCLESYDSVQGLKRKIMKEKIEKTQASLNPKP